MQEIMLYLMQESNPELNGLIDSLDLELVPVSVPTAA